MDQLIEFWSDIRNVENASSEDMQKDILAYLRRLVGVQQVMDDAEMRVSDAIAERNDLQVESDRLRKALETISNPPFIIGSTALQHMQIARDALGIKEEVES